MNRTESRAPSATESTPRRSFMWEIGALAVGAVTSLAGLSVGVTVFLDPLLRKPQPPLKYRRTSNAGEGYLRVAALSSIPEDGVPRRFAVIADRADAWNYVPDQPVGAVYLRREAGQELQVFQATCPHAGCSVSTTDENGGAFHCPCHNSSFDWNGKRVPRPGKVNPAPRDMDSLKYKVVDGDVWVEFKEFYTGRPEATPKS
jgi:menaquinol-cytochrome c reductase iron-sulfur subunit